jgi:phosphatidylserine/phosphatidylglycerophosphate/cardiolipin synthase-like enzyme
MIVRMNEVPFPIPFQVSGKILPLLGTYFFDELIDSIAKSTLSIFAIQYQWKWLIHERNSRVQRLGTEIIKARARGVSVNVLLNQESPNRNLSIINRFTADILTRGGCSVRLLRTASLLHTKLWVIDSRYSFVGSHNISTRALGVNEEFSVKIESKEFAKFSQKYYQTLWESR